MAEKPGYTFSNWTGGVNSLLMPDGIGVNQYSWAVNVVNRGGILQSRPGYDKRASILGSKLQGGTIFTPKNSRPLMLVAVDGYIYVSKFPFTTFIKIESLKFLASAPIINFQPCLKSVTLNPDGSLTLVDSLPLVIIQDGETNAGVYDGIKGYHSIAGTPTFGIPIGLWMAFTASRLWVFNQSRAYVSDLAAPDTFNENLYVAERSNFELPGIITGAIETTDEKTLLVFTDTTTTAFQANIRDRTLWSQTPDFQKVILPSIGCISGRSPINHFGVTWWNSSAGYINLDAALYTQQTSKLMTVDREMMRSKRILSPDQSQACSATYENFLMFSVPAGGKYNEQTWVADQSPEGQASTSGMAWVGIWTGTRPVVWMTTRVGGRERLYFASFDATASDNTNIHIWEAFQSDRRDNDGRIASQVETGMLTFADLHQFRHAEIVVCELLGDVELRVFVGGTRGKWHQVKDITLQAEEGSLGSSVQKTITKESILQSFKPQTRFIKTEEFSPQSRGCSGPESTDTPGLDKGFQLLFEWRGRMGIKSVTFIVDPEPSATVGECKTGEAGRHNILTDQGETL